MRTRAQAVPDPSAAMFFYKTQRLAFDAEIFGRVKLVAATADLVGAHAWAVSWGGCGACASAVRALLASDTTPWCA
jgi:hypothetical protein